ncbi:MULTISPECIES: hypothetical protein [Ramlibacter]|uniref:Outer membrane protein assembly factor BamE n=1 Tax=Ramlibacter pinisoli TaxID=2682844 RepID=A0A6N8IVT3_9BURK|nr:MULTISPECIES: hypothetical protein [Ramlibacter]MBA2960952.1 hypothetical protein [Ramlibacter sp. CGMCC 1.13660]MVQ30898.1 hypothetical protein [Ramlibacter pinisoli]
MTRRVHTFLATLSLALGAALAGCATGSGLEPGATRDAVIQRMGQPTAVVRLPNGGERLQYSQQPAGQYAWMADFDAGGRLVSLRQVLNENDFRRIEVGQWTRDDVEREFGPAARVERMRGWDGPILTYRWNMGPGMDRFFWVYVDPQGVVRRAHQGIEFLRAGPRRA